MHKLRTDDRPSSSHFPHVLLSSFSKILQSQGAATSLYAQTIEKWLAEWDRVHDCLDGKDRKKPRESCKILTSLLLPFVEGSWSTLDNKADGLIEFSNCEEEELCTSIHTISQSESVESFAIAWKKTSIEFRYSSHISLFNSPDRPSFFSAMADDFSAIFQPA